MFKVLKMQQLLSLQKYVHVYAVSIYLSCAVTVLYNSFCVFVLFFFSVHIFVYTYIPKRVIKKKYQLLCTSSQGPRLVRDINTSAYEQGAVEPVQNLWAFLGTKSTHRWRPILGLSNPNL